MIFTLAEAIHKTFNAVGGWAKQASASFLKKRSKKLLFTGGCGAVMAKSRGAQKFFASFFQKRSAFLVCYSARA
jgi:hypothetical protein